MFEWLPKATLIVDVENIEVEPSVEACPYDCCLGYPQGHCVTLETPTCGDRADLGEVRSRD